MTKRPLECVTAVLFCFSAHPAFLQAQAGPNQPQTKDARATVQGASFTNPPKDARTRLHFFSHRIHFLTADSVTHFRYMDAGPEKVTARDEYYKVSTKVQINLRGDGITYLQARAESGRSFNSSFDYTGIGLHQGYWSFNLKSLSLGQRVGKHIELQAGGIEYDQGAGTEATYADNDGWLEGYRLRYVGLGHLLPDRVSVTMGYVGDPTQPNVFARLHRMGDENYVQVLAVKGVAKNRDLSAEFDSLQSIPFARGAFRWQQLPIPFDPDLTLEAISRASDKPTFGWAGSLGRNLDKKGRFRVGMFYSDIPTGMFQNGSVQIFWNGDCYALGKRVGPNLRFAAFKDVDFALFASERLDRTSGTRYRGQISVHYRFAGLLNRGVQ